MAGKKDTAKAARREKPKTGKTKSKTTAKTKVERVWVPASLTGENLLERVSDGIVAFDAGMNYTYVNARGAELLGRNPEDLVGKNYWEEYPEAKGTPFAKAYQRALKTQEALVIEDYYAPWDRWFENRIYPSQDGLLIFFHDITGRKRVELGLLQAEEKYRGIFENAVEGIFQSTPQGRFINVNPAMARIYGYDSPQEMVASVTDISRQIYADSASRREFTSQITSKGFVENFEARNLRKDGSLSWTKTNARAIKDANGKVIYYEGFVTNITERKQAEEQLAEKQKFLEIITGAMPDIVYLYNPRQQRHVYINRELESLLGYSSEEIKKVGADLLLKSVHPQDLPRVMEHIQTLASARDDSFHELEYRIKGKGGGYLWLFVREKVYLRNDVGQPELLFGIVQDITERKRAEENLTYQASLLANVNDAIIASDENFVLTAWNHAAERIYGWKAEEVIGKSGAEILQTEFLTISRPEAIKQLIESGEYFAEVLNSRKDGVKIYIETRTTALRDPLGKTIGYVSINRDITERKRAEEALRDSEERLRLSTELADVAVWEYSFATNSMSRSKNHDKLYGLAWQDKWEFDTFLNATHPDDRAYSNEIIQRSAAPGGPDQYAFDFRVIYPDQSIHWLNVIGQVVERDPEGHGTMVRGTLIDITERKRAEAELRESEQRFATLFERSAFVAVLSSLPNGIMLNVNAAFERVFGFTKEEAIGRTTLELGIHPDAAGRQRVFAQLQAQGSARDIELELHTRSGEARTFLVNVDLIDIGDEKYVLNTMQDITERKRARDELRLSRNRLGELARQLVQAHETESRAIGRELHDQIGQMLTALKLTLEIAPQLPPEQGTKKLSQAQELVNDLLNRVSRLSLELRPPMLDDLGLIPALLWHVNRYEDQTGIEVDFKHSGAEGVRFNAEIETTAYRIVQESLTNVARHARATRAMLEVRVEADGMKIQIEDDGAGFDPQAALEQQRGLSGMRERVRLLGGSFQIESQPGKGTKKFIHLPLGEKIP